MSIDRALRAVVSGLPGALAAFCLTAQAAPPLLPGAGTIIQEAEPVAPPAPSSSATGLRIQQENGPAVPATAPFAVTTLHITGSTVFTAPLLHALVADAEGQDLGLSGLQALAARISDYYHAHGFPLARAIIPAQTIRAGVVEIEVIEARYDTVTLDNHSRVRDPLLRATLAPLQSGELIAQAPLDHALLLLSDIPGVLTSAVLSPGAAVGTSGLRVQSTAGPLLTGTVALDNDGNRYTGDARLGGTVDLIDPLRQGDVLSASGLSSGSGMNYGRLGYEVLLNGQGTRSGASLSTLHYILGNSLASLDGHGIAQVESLWVRQPLRRAPTANFYGQIQFDHKQLDDDLGAGDIRTDRHLDNWTASLAGDWRDALFAGGSNAWNLAATSGQVGFGAGNAALVDSASARTAGRFTHWTASLDRLQSLGARDALYLAVSAQWASGNLDASEKLLAGGPYSVRAYETGALSGDTGYLGSLEYRRVLGRVLRGDWQTVAFVDSEHLRIDKSPWTSGLNGATLSGAGASLGFTARAQWYAKATVAFPIGATPELAGSRSSARLWAELGWNF